MRPGLIGAFAAGFAAGMLTLAVALWGSGKLSRPIPQAPTAVSESAEDMVRGTPPPRVAAAVPDPVALEGREAKDRPSMPLAGFDPTRLTSNFSQKRAGHAHEALDIMAPRGTPVMAVVEGNVAKLFTSKEGGLTVYQFDNPGVWCYYYAHLDHYVSGLKEGMLLRRGQVLGYVGSTGNASPDAPHLHFAIFRLGPEKEWWKGTAVDPLPILQGR
jgi:murein DD-endopeptidase MepM/ murein hydrolase activator NlpD